jgi:hypothetical protein
MSATQCCAKILKGGGKEKGGTPVANGASQIQSSRMNLSRTLDPVPNTLAPEFEELLPEKRTRRTRINAERTNIDLQIRTNSTLTVSLPPSGSQKGCGQIGVAVIWISASGEGSECCSCARLHHFKPSKFSHQRRVISTREDNVRGYFTLCFG